MKREQRHGLWQAATRLTSGPFRYKTPADVYHLLKPGRGGIVRVEEKRGRGARDGAIDQPLDHRGAWGTALGDGECGPRRHVPLRPAGETMSSEDPVVFVVDDDKAFRDALRRLLTSVGLSVEVFPSAQAFLSSPRRHAPGCLVLDVRLPGLSGLDLQQELANTDTTLPIIFLTGHGDIPMSVRAMKAGAVEFLTKPFREQDLLDAIRHAIDRDRVERAERLELAELRRRYDLLTPRERDVLGAAVAGLLNKQIAGQLGTSEATVKEQRGHVMQKMQAGSLADLVRSASRLGITPAGSGPTPPR
jgi:FixJ family two-component response regulator